MKIKKNAIIVLAFAVLCCSLGYLCSNLTRANAADESAVCSANVKGLKFCSSTPRIEVNSGDEIIILTSLKNVSQTDLSVNVTGGYLNSRFGIKVMDENNREIIPFLEKKIADGTITDEESQEYLGQRAISHRVMKLAAGAVLNEKIRISDYYQLTQGGHYFVEVSRKNREQDNSGSYSISLPKRIKIKVR